MSTILETLPIGITDEYMLERVRKAFFLFYKFE